jgi:hypothetical protein
MDYKLSHLMISKITNYSFKIYNSILSERWII